MTRFQWLLEAPAGVAHLPAPKDEEHFAGGAYKPIREELGPVQSGQILAGHQIVKILPSSDFVYAPNDAGQ